MLKEMDKETGHAQKSPGSGGSAKVPGMSEPWTSLGGLPRILPIKILQGGAGVIQTVCTKKSSKHSSQ